METGSALNPHLMDDAAVAAFLGVSKATVWRRAADGTIPKPIKLGGSSRWIRSELLIAIEQAKTARNLHQAAK